MEPIDEHKAIALLREVVKGNEFHVYVQAPSGDGADDDETVCRYQYAGQPSCVVGKALALAGASVDILEWLDDGGNGANGALSAIQLSDHMECVTSTAAILFNEAQVRQDNGETWGEALQYAEAYYTSKGSAR